jgi:hypothetical protein
MNNTYDAYAIGYYDGRHNGVENNVYDESKLRVLYTMGYERGVADYCFYEVTE